MICTEENGGGKDIHCIVHKIMRYLLIYFEISFGKSRIKIMFKCPVLKDFLLAKDIIDPLLNIFIPSFYNIHIYKKFKKISITDYQHWKEKKG